MLVRPILFALAMTLPIAVQAQIPSAQLPLMVRKAVAALDTDCRRYGGKPGRSPDLLKIADINGDGIRDYVTDLNSYTCGGAASAMGGGQQGALLTVYAGGPSNTAIQVYSDTVHGSKIETVAGEAHLWVDVAGDSCGQRNAAKLPFSQIESCGRELIWNAAKQTFNYAPLAQKRRY